MKRLLATVALCACTSQPVVIGGIRLDLVTPADLDPMVGASALRVRVLDPNGLEIASETGTASGVTLPPITTFGVVEIEVTALSGARVIAAALTGPIAIGPDDQHTLVALFLPVNEPVQLNWTPDADRVEHSAHLSPDGRVLLMGGREPGGVGRWESSEWWHISNGFDGTGPALPEPSYGARVTPLADGGALVAGGFRNSSATDAAWVLSADGSRFKKALAMSSVRSELCTTTHPTLGAMAIGVGPVDIYNTDGHVDSINDFRGDAVSTCQVTADGYLITAGTTGWSAFDLRDATTPLRLMSHYTSISGVPNVQGAISATLPDGKVWVASGVTNAIPSTSARIVNPADATTVRSADLTAPRLNAFAAPWRHGALVLAGGTRSLNGGGTHSVEIFDPLAGQKVQIDLDVDGSTFTLLPGGTLLSTGGLDADGAPAGAVAIQPWIED
ncbi:MAG: hypothetical protein ACI9MC_003199 [Kiritimatiellia bacterium]|jgi:hypothetical protein